MNNIEARNVNDALKGGLRALVNGAVKEETRNGEAMVLEGPTTTVYGQPRERVIFWPERDANPYFHFMEGLWMLGGRKDVAFIEQFNSKMADFSDDGVTFHGAYGYRWRHHFGFDQLEVIGEQLREDPGSRRNVLQMWDPQTDLGRKGKDFPCNTEIAFRVAEDDGQYLDMTVFNRSNDMIWGAYGANAVHMSMLQEYMAARVGMPVGMYWQVSNNLHVYSGMEKKLLPILTKGSREDLPYETREVEPYPMVSIDIETWDQDLMMFLEEGPIVGFREAFFRKVATPMFHSWAAWKNKNDPRRIETAQEVIEQCAASDWRKACWEWLERKK